MLQLDIFWAKILKKYCLISSQQLQIYIFAKFREKTKMPKFEKKSASFGYFWAKIFKKYCCFSSQQPPIYIFAKFCKKIKMHKFCSKSALFGYFWARILKKLLPHLKSAPSNLSICNISWKNKNA